MRQLAILLVVLLIQLCLSVTEIREYDFVDLSVHDKNTTYGEHFTNLKSIPDVGRFEWKVYQAPKALINDKAEIVEPFQHILGWTSNVDEKTIGVNINLKNPEGNSTYSGIVQTPYSQFTIESSEDGTISLQFFLGGDWNDYNAMRMIVDFYGSTNYTMEYFGPAKAGQFKATDLLAEGFEDPVIVHDAKVLDFKKTAFQRALIIDTKTVGKCLLLDQITQYCEKLGNYTNVFYDYVKEFKPKDILMIGGGDLVILKKFAQSELWKDINSFTKCEIDQGVIEISKKHFHPNSETWLNDPKITIRIEDANKYVLDLPLDVKYDAILMDTTDPDVMISLKLFQKDFFEKLRDHHLKTPDSFILMQYGLIEEQIKSKTVSKNLISHMKHPSSANLFKTKVIIRYTPEYIGHTVFYHFKKNPNHYFFENITESAVDFTSVANPMNRTFGEHLTLVKKENGSATVLAKNSLNITMFGVDLDKAKDKKSFHSTIKNILEFANSELDEQEYEFKRRYFWAKYEFDDETSELEFYSLNSTTLSFSIHVEDSKKADFFNIAALIVHYFNPMDYTVNKFESKDSFNYTKGDLVAYESGEYTFIHGAKIIDWVETKYQKVLVFDSTQLGVGMIIDSSILVLKNSKNYVDFYYSKVKELKPKNILIIGGADLSVLERIANSDLFADIEKIKVLDNDKEMMDLSKKYLHPDFDKWFDAKKIEFLHTDADKYVQKAEGSNESYDLIIMTTSTPNEKGESVEFGTRFFIRLNGYLLNTKGTVLLHSGHVTEDGYYAEHKEKMPTFLPLFEYKTEAVFTPQFTGHLIVYTLTKKY